MAIPRQQGGGNDFVTISNYSKGYRNREDKTNLLPGVLVVGSQNVLTTTEERVGSRKGFTLDGGAETAIAPILASYDWDMHIGQERHVKAGFMTTASNGKLKYRYVDSSDVVTWRDLMTSLTSVAFNFTTFWDFDTEKKDFLLFVDGSTNVYEWTGGITTFASATASTITKEGTAFWAEENFYNLNNALGGSTTQFDITNTAGTTFRYTYDGTGTNPNITAALLPIGMTVYIAAQNFNAANNGVFTVTGSAANYFEITNAAGVAENNVTIGTGFINYFVNQIVIGGITYSYNGGGGTTTLTGVTPDPTLGGHVAGDIIHQKVKTMPNAGIASLPPTFANAIIGNLRNQIYIGSLTDRSVYVSQVNDYKSFAFTSPTRVVGEGAILTLDGVPTGFIPQENKMTISAGKDQWYETKFTLSADLTDEDFAVDRLKTASRQAAQSQAAISKIKNDIVFVSFEPTLNTLGRVKNVVLTQQAEDISNSIKNDFDNYDFTDCSVAYHRDFIYVAVPAENTVRIYNIVNGFWEAPQIMPISRFAVIDGELYGHSYQVGETYKLFDGYNDNGNPIDARAVFSYNNYGTRTMKKGVNEAYAEGYISSNTQLTMGKTYEIDGCATNTSFILPNEQPYVCAYSSDASLGKVSLGKNPLGSSLQQLDPSSLPPKFRWIRTFPKVYFYEEQISFSSNGIDQRWELLAFGSKILPAGDQNNNIKT